MRFRAVRLILVASVLAAGCKPESSTTATAPSTGGSAAAAEVTLYTSVDQPVAEPIVRAFEQRSGVRVRLITDAEATKSAGLAARLLAEKANPQADVFWGNEVFHTINLGRKGVLAAYASPEAKSIPDQYKDPKHLWAGTCLRARVIATAEPTGDGGTAAGPAAGGKPRWAAHVEALTDPALRNRVALARPTAGTTGGHVSALYAVWGRDRADGFFRSLHANGAKVLGGNSVVAEQVGQGQMLAGLTDNDDVAAARRAGGQLTLNLPDQGEGELGTLTIPCTVALVAGRPDGGAGKKLADHLLSDEVERTLIEAKFGQQSVRAAVGHAVRTMDVTYETIADHMAWAPGRAATLLEGREPAQ